MTYLIVFLTAIFSIAAFRNHSLWERFALIPYRVVHERQWWRIFTHGFIHADYVHLLVNMFVLLSFGQYLERTFASMHQIGMISSGDGWFLLLYFGGMVAASLRDVMVQRNNPRFVSIGASGAVSAVVFASIFFNPWSKIYLFALIPIPGIIFGALYVAYSQWMGSRQSDSINHYAHLYGALFGFLFPLLMDSSLLSVFLENLTHF